MIDPIPYTHWSYFRDRDAAEVCAVALDVLFDCLTSVQEAAGPVEDGRPWLLLASRPVRLGTDWHGEVEEIVTMYGGFYDGGESGWLNLETGKYLEGEAP